MNYYYFLKKKNFIVKRVEKGTNRQRFEEVKIKFGKSWE